MKMLEMCEAERPREKMLSKGPAALGDSELISILLRTGNRGESAAELSNRILKTAGGRLSEIAAMSVSKLTGIEGIGPGKACSIAAAFELGRRFMQEESSVERIPIVTSRQVFKLMKPLMKGLKHEECWVLMLNNSNYLTDKCRVTSGGDASTVIDVRQIVRLALEKAATAIILVHNHPTGNPMPSQADIRETEALKKACGTCSITLFDHVVICDDGWFSFAEERQGSGK